MLCTCVSNFCGSKGLGFEQNVLNFDPFKLTGLNNSLKSVE